jgi:hypothetical protein
LFNLFEDPIMNTSFIHLFHLLYLILYRLYNLLYSLTVLISILWRNILPKSTTYASLSNARENEGQASCVYHRVVEFVF